MANGLPPAPFYTRSQEGHDSGCPAQCISDEVERRRREHPGVLESAAVAQPPRIPASGRVSVVRRIEPHRESRDRLLPHELNGLQSTGCFPFLCLRRFFFLLGVAWYFGSDCLKPMSAKSCAARCATQYAESVRRFAPQITGVEATPSQWFAARAKSRIVRRSGAQLRNVATVSTSTATPRGPRRE